MRENESKTVVLLNQARERPVSRVRVDFPLPNGRRATRLFENNFVVGRDPACDICIADDGISRQHFEVSLDRGLWWIRDLDSSNGTYLDGSPVQRTALHDRASVSFYAGGPVIHLASDSGRAGQVQAGAAHSPPRRQAGVQQTTPSSEFDEFQRRHRRRFWFGMAAMSSLLLVAIGVIVYQQTDRSDSHAIAERLFYESKSLELELARLKRELVSRPDQPLAAAVQQAGARLHNMQARYADLAEEMQLIGSHRSKEDLLIFRIARIFGEYDLSIPDSFVSEVKRYIRKWQQSPRLHDAVQRIKQGDRAQRVVNALRARGLPPQFIYLAVQESNFTTDAIGPETRYGIAKGMWQFIPQTASKYGLKVGPDKDKRRYDPYDERFDFDKATEAAADYLSFIYTTEAQASGLLVMSAYNWGEGNIARIVNRIPDDPAERNFWHLLETQMIPDETYTYVLSIFSAAVIGEDPRHFGFEFDNPIAER